MKIGILTDIHNNVEALNAVLEKFEEENCRKTVCAGDIIGIGPRPEETVRRVMSIPNLIAVRGNHEKYLLEGIPTTYPNEEKMGYEEMESHKWEHSRLSADSVDFLRALPYRADFCVHGKNISVMHYCMNEKRQYVGYTPNPTAQSLSKLFPEKEQDIVIFGHDHARTICQSRNRRFINSGSLGCPSREGIARAAILEIAQSGEVSVRSLDVEYDVSTVIADIDRLNYPACEEIKQFFFGVD